MSMVPAFAAVRRNMPVMARRCYSGVSAMANTNAGWSSNATRQVALSVMLASAGAVGTSTAACEGSEDGVITRIKKMAGGEEAFDLNGLTDQIARTAGSKIQTAVESGVPTQLSYGFIMGYSSGYALKKAGKIACGVMGTGFLILQALSFSGYIKVDHVKIEGKFKDLLDVNDDGKIDQEDRDEIMAKVMEIAEFGMPSGGGFAAGFIGGAKSG
uniref:EF-hand domain-containing protein n=1 Tax=Attheya septentrionalis TaxID=420275 RepID=A0A7S2U8Y8_9STRA|mmetsp:Transcript_15526/g.28213  ORF Transcript_15526/g.28213 Transcript_15526/m.28213 type:complete len:214 (+) Transcript_15526:162-803(+)|eukprot:CAMPEP_0198280710 /NCGR_PEP_ID=MMETSP1449-20131203/738_1 /TAXON_ID=420275 /ORGANISM="Attheya septentrionalis, Strain CCMP2084" /LENGTH=213 /DNA_ID=CAMNT_0043976143 /DNA_START=149 /DNA_END=790 /DNA_ORIENTATION=-